MNGAAEVADAVVAAIHSGDIAGLRQLLAKHLGVASAPLGGMYKSRTPLHAVADWPGYFPNGPEIVRLLVDAGADPDARQSGEETPLHWAASSDDWHVAVALIDAGADINAPDGSIGTPLANAVGYGCWTWPGSRRRQRRPAVDRGFVRLARPARGAPRRQPVLAAGVPSVLARLLRRATSRRRLPARPRSGSRSCDQQVPMPALY